MRLGGVFEGLESVGGLTLNVGQNEKRRLFKLLGLALAGGMLYLPGGLGANAEATIDAYRPN